MHFLKVSIYPSHLKQISNVARLIRSANEFRLACFVNLINAANKGTKLAKNQRKVVEKHEQKLRFNKFLFIRFQYALVVKAIFEIYWLINFRLLFNKPSYHFLCYMRHEKLFNRKWFCRTSRFRKINGNIFF